MFCFKLIDFKVTLVGLPNPIMFQGGKQNSLPEYVRVVEVGPRDGLQNEPISVPTDVKVEFINRLSQSGLKAIEVTR